MNLKNNQLIPVAVILILGGMIFWLTRKSPDQTPTVSKSQTSPAGEIDSQAWLNSFHDKLLRDSDPDSVKALLATLYHRFQKMPPEQAAAAMAAFLDSGTDAQTGLDLKVSENGDGSLETSSSLRVALLDLLGRIAPDLAGPASEKILESPDSPDEWAVALRNISRAYPGDKGTTILKQKSLELLNNAEWRENPTIGYFEAFDSFVQTGHTEAIPEIATLFHDPERKDLGHAGFMTLDRLTINNPADAMTELLTTSDLHKSNGPMVANFFARADVRDPRQAALLAEYLKDEARTLMELESWAGVYPNGNYIHSNNLMTKINNRSRADLIDHDAKALDLITKWLTEPGFQSVRKPLQTAQNRLRVFVHQASKPEPLQ